MFFDRQFRNRARLTAGGAGVVFLAAVMAGWGYEQWAWRRDAARAPEPGRLVEMGSGRRQLYCVGAGGPVVILESGLGDTLGQWEKVQGKAGERQRVCSYDRAGHGGSDEGAGARTSARIAEELHALLERAGERGPYVLVGSSAGGYHVRVFAGRYPAEVAGMVLVDATQEDQYRLLPAGWQRLAEGMRQRYRRQARWARWEVGSGWLRLRLARDGVRAPYLLLQSKYFRSRAAELEQIEVSAEQARAAGGLGAKPLVVLSAGLADAALRTNLGEGDQAAFQRVWLEELQARLARLSERAEWRILRDSGHDIAAERPDAVVEAIAAVSDGGGAFGVPSKIHD